MKKYLLLMIIITIIPAMVYAWGIGILQGGVDDGGGASCLSGTYAFHWDGDYDAELTACVDNGGDTITWSQNGGDLGTSYGESGPVGFMGNAVDEYIAFAKSTMGSDTGTIFVRYKVVTVSDAESVNFTGVNSSSTDYISVKAELDLDQYVYGRWNDNGDFLQLADYTRAEWHTIGITFRIDAGLDLGGCYDSNCEGTASWTCSDKDVVAWGTDPDEVRVGDNDDGLTFTTDDEVYIDKVLIINSYQADEISGW